MTDHDRPSKVTFVRGNARLHELLAQPEIAAEVAKIEAEIEAQAHADNRE